MSRGQDSGGKDLSHLCTGLFKVIGNCILSQSCNKLREGSQKNAKVWSLTTKGGGRFSETTPLIAKSNTITITIIKDKNYLQKIKITIRRPHFSIGEGFASVVKDHTFTIFFFGTLP